MKRDQRRESILILKFSALPIILETFLGGWFGKVYLGTLENGVKVAVKVLSSHSRQGCKEFQSEEDLLMKVRHENVLKLIGYCDDSGEMALIYEYMDNKDLKPQLLETSENILNWNKRLRISLDVAKGLEYMHKCCNPPIIHGDFKPSNILLNENYQAKIAGFRLSKDLKNEGDTHETTSCVVGSIGYIDPEYVASSKYNKKSDIYSFGIVLLELITGQPVINDSTQKAVIYPKRCCLEVTRSIQCYFCSESCRISHFLHSENCNSTARYDACGGRIRGMFGNRNNLHNRK